MGVSRSRAALVVFLVIFSVIFAGCGNDGAQNAPQADAGPPYKVTGNEGSITGSVLYTGSQPTPSTYSMASDPVCAKGGEATSEELLVADGKLQNAFVYIKSGLPKNSFTPPSTEVVLDQRGCRFVPHVLGVQTHQSLKIVNSDETSHSIHPTPKINKGWNETQYMSASPIVKRFPLEEALIPVKCNLHSWMRAYIGVLSHPFFAVSAADGSFSIKGVPPGEYEVEAWHEKLGARTMTLKVAEKSEATVEFRFDESAVYQPGSLKPAPALILP